MVTANLNGSYHSAIIGMDAQFTNQASVQRDIDRVERALYLGNIAGKVAKKAVSEVIDKEQRQPCADFTEFSMESCQQAVERMATANKVNSSDISVIIVSENRVAENGISENVVTENAAFETEQTVSELESAFEKTIVVNSLAKALVQLERLVQDNKLVALVGINSVELSYEPSNEQQSEELRSTISFDQTFNGYQACNGIAALLFAPIAFVQATNCYVYSRLKGFSVGDNIKQTIQSALNNSAVNAVDIGLLEVSALTNTHSVKAESSAVLSSYQSKQLTTAISCARSVSGEGKGFSQVLGLLRTVIALQQRYIPAISDWQHPQESELALWQASNFYLPTESRPWFPHQDGSAHIAAYSCLAANDDYCHLVLQESLQQNIHLKHQQNKSSAVDEKHPASDIRHNGFIACSDLKMVLVTADSEQGLLSKLIKLQDSQQSLSDIALSCYNQVQENVGSYTVSLLAESKEELSKEIQSATSGITSAFEAQKEWRTPKGSYFTPVPVNVASADDQNISFLYPGIGATYVGLGRDLFHLFPEIHQDVANLADNIGASLKDTLLNPRTIIRPDFKALKQLDLNLRGNLADIAEAGVGFACVFTKVFENVFKVKADYATGYSMGEVSMYAALGAWQQPGLMSARLANSETFNQRLCGDLLTLREHWGLPVIAKEESLQQEHSELENVTPENELIWETYTIKATLDEVLAASEGEDRVYCTIVNTPDSLLVAGYPEDCLRVIKKLGVRAMALNMANAIHSPPAKNEYNDMVTLYTMDVTSRLKTKMYSSSCYLPVPQLSKAIAHSVAKCLCDRVDFPRLVNTMYDKGARVFIEMGPGRSLCSWVDKTLDFDNSQANKKADKARVSVPVNAKGTSDELTYLRAVAKLISHGVKLDLHRLFYGSIIVNKT